MVAEVKQASDVKRKIALSKHAAKRYSERVDFCISLLEAITRLRQDVESLGVITSSPPDWLLESPKEKETASAYLTIGENCVLPLAKSKRGEAEFKAVTLIVKNHGSHIIHRSNYG